MSNKVPQVETNQASAGKEKKPYERPRILSTEKLEVVAATCDGSKAVFDGVSQCGTISPLNS